MFTTISYFEARIVSESYEHTAGHALLLQVLTQALMLMTCIPEIHYLQILIPMTPYINNFNWGTSTYYTDPYYFY